ncbi:hypothetical protein EDC94DRAFT_670932 [Helicostylum pulchrum]|nr:hypothetical protein EDC94DRAFT_670932 [Helicostylum pulchrum]
MLSVRLLTLLVLILVQGIHGFCIYNKFTDGTSFSINQNNSGTSQGKVFKKHMEMGSIVCCHYTNIDCSRRKRNDDSIQFIISFPCKTGTSPSLKIAICATGGALVLSDPYYGSAIDSF